MKSYKVHFVDGKTFNVTADEKLTPKKLSVKYLPFINSGDDASRIFLNSDNILMIEEIKVIKKKTNNKASSKKRGRKPKPAAAGNNAAVDVLNNPPM